MKYLNEDQIKEMRSVRDELIGSYSARDLMLQRYDEIYFMTRGEKPRMLKGVDEKDIKETISSSGRDAVTGLKRILDSGDVHITIEGAADNDKLESALKTMLQVSGEYKIASVEKDLNLSASLYGPSTLMVESVDDLIETQGKPITEDKGNGYGEHKQGMNEYVVAQLRRLKEKTPFLLHTVNAPQSYPLWGAYGMIGHCRKYTLKGVEIQDRWGVDCKEPNKNYDIKDFFYYEKRLVEAVGIDEPLMACEWVSRDEAGEMIGSINIPVFTRFSGGSHLFAEPDKQSQPLLYAWAFILHLFIHGNFSARVTRSVVDSRP
jgi:hypothetical protein